MNDSVKLAVIAFDKNFKGALTFDELENAVRACGKTVYDEDSQKIAELMGKQETVSLAEAEQIVQKMVTDVDCVGELKKTFGRFDRNKSGTISTGEFRSILKLRATILLSEEAQDCLLKMADPQNTGRIAYSDLIRILVL